MDRRPVETGPRLRAQAARLRDAAFLRVLAFGRRQAGHVEPVDLNSHLRSMRDMLRRLIGEHIHLEMDLTDALAVARIDTSHLEQVVMNLAINARDAMQDGGLLSIGTGRHAAAPSGGSGEPDMVVLRVQDTGAGMSSEVLERIFEPFLSGKPTGMGLGLAVSRAIVEAHGGRLDSCPGAHGEFRLVLPIERRA